VGGVGGGRSKGVVEGSTEKSGGDGGRRGAWGGDGGGVGRGVGRSGGGRMWGGEGRRGLCLLTPSPKVTNEKKESRLSKDCLLILLGLREGQ